MDKPATAAPFAPPPVRFTVKGEKTVRHGRLYGNVTKRFAEGIRFAIRVMNERGEIVDAVLGLDDAKRFAEHVIRAVDAVQPEGPDGLDDIFGEVKP